MPTIELKPIERVHQPGVFMPETYADIRARIGSIPSSLRRSVAPSLPRQIPRLIPAWLPCLIPRWIRRWCADFYFMIITWLQYS